MTGRDELGFVGDVQFEQGKHGGRSVVPGALLPLQNAEHNKNISKSVVQICRVYG